MARPIVYDMTRLAIRLVKRTPNGIDRVDSAFARHFISTAQPDNAGLMMTLLGPRLVSQNTARAIIDSVSSHWGEADEPDRDVSYCKIVDWINDLTPNSSRPARISCPRPEHAGSVFRLIGREGIPIGRSPRANVAKNAIYLNTSQFPLWIESYFGWQRHRLDVKPVFFIHDLLPIEAPEYFPRGEYARHMARLNNLAAFGAAAIVATEAVRTALSKHLRSIGRAELPILVAPIPAEPIFSTRDGMDPRLLEHPYFVICGTIEPRKNHLLLLQVWRELVRREGATAPKLIIIGNRGWENENAIDMLERCPAIRDHVLEVSGLATPSLKRLLDGACALLMPTFAEGFGLPIVEALAAGVRVVTSDLEVFRETGDDSIITISPIDGGRWLETIQHLTRTHSPKKKPLGGMEKRPDWQDYFRAVEAFFTKL